MINPILASSARRRMRSIRTPILITLYGAMIFAVGLGAAFGAFASSTLSIFAMREGVTAYAAMLAIQFAMILLITPAMTAGSIAGERERQTLDMLLVTNTGSLRIVAGKLLESLGYVALLLVAALPTMCLTLITGGVTLADVLPCYNPFPARKPGEPAAEYSGVCGGGILRREDSVRAAVSESAVRRGRGGLPAGREGLSGGRRGVFHGEGIPAGKGDGLVAGRAAVGGNEAAR